MNDSLNTFENYLIDKLLNQRIDSNKDYLLKSFEDGIFIFMLDGYDELYSNELLTVNKQILAFIDRYPDNHFIITSRPGTGVERFERFITYRINKLKPVEIVDFVRKVINEIERQENILKIIRTEKSNEKSKIYTSYLSNPLLLSMFLRSFKQFPEIPSSRNIFYRNIFNTLYSQHDGVNKNSFERERISGLNKDEFERLISYFAFNTFFLGKFSFDFQYMEYILKKLNNSSRTIKKFEANKVIKDLVVSINIINKDGIEYYFPHKTLQEYFAVNHIQKISNETNNLEVKKNIYHKFYTDVIQPPINQTIDYEGY